MDRSKYRYGIPGKPTPWLQYIKQLGHFPKVVPLFPLDHILGHAKNAITFAKIDTDSIDCDILREMVDRQRRGEFSFDAASLEVWAGPVCKDNTLFSQLLADLQADGYDIYRAPAAYGNTPNTLTTRLPATVELPELSTPVYLRTSTLWRFKVFTLKIWLAIDKKVLARSQMGVSKVRWPEIPK
eukprot:m.82106 g.82106  ORF g.82106 m.82106 type:complete len:184 (-) comp19536_c0_seq1:159-710(-)